MQTDYHAQLDALNAELAQLDAEFVALTTLTPDTNAPGGIIQSAIHAIQKGTRLLDEKSRLSQIVEGLERYYSQCQQARTARAQADGAQALMKRIDALKSRTQTAIFEYDRAAVGGTRNDTFRSLLNAGVPDAVLKSVERAAVESVDTRATA